MSLQNRNKPTSRTHSLNEESFLALSRLAFIDIRLSGGFETPAKPSTPPRITRQEDLTRARLELHRSQEQEINRYTAHVRVLHQRAALLLEAVDVKSRIDTGQHMSHTNPVVAGMIATHLDSLRQLLSNAVEDLSGRILSSIDLLIRRRNRVAFSNPLGFPDLIEASTSFLTRWRESQLNQDSGIQPLRMLIDQTQQALERATAFRSMPIKIPSDILMALAQNRSKSTTNRGEASLDSFPEFQRAFLAKPEGEIIGAITLRNSSEGAAFHAALRHGIAKQGTRPYARALRGIVREYCSIQEFLFTRYLQEAKTTVDGNAPTTDAMRASISTYLATAASEPTSVRLTRIMELRREFPHVPEPVISLTELGLARNLISGEIASLRDRQEQLIARLHLSPAMAAAIAPHIDQAHARALEGLFQTTSLSADILRAVARSTKEILLRPLPEISQILSDIATFLSDHPRAILVREYDPRRSPKRFNSVRQIDATRKELETKLASEEGRLAFRYECAASEISTKLERFNFSPQDASTVALLLLHGQSCAPYTFDPEMPSRTAKQWLKQTQAALPEWSFPGIAAIGNLLSRAASINLLLRGDTAATRYHYRLSPRPGGMLGDDTILTFLYGTLDEGRRPEPRKPPTPIHVQSIPIPPTPIPTHQQQPVLDRGVAKAIKTNARTLENAIVALLRNMTTLSSAPTAMRSSDEATTFYTTLLTALEETKLSPFADLPRTFRDIATPHLKQARISLLSDALKGEKTARSTPPEIHRDYREAIRRSLRDWWSKQVSAPRLRTMVNARSVVNDLRSLSRSLANNGASILDHPTISLLNQDIQSIRDSLPPLEDLPSTIQGDPKPEVIARIGTAVESLSAEVIPRLKRTLESTSVQIDLHTELVEQLMRGELDSLSEKSCVLANRLSVERADEIRAAMRAAFGLPSTALNSKKPREVI